MRQQNRRGIRIRIAEGGRRFFCKTLVHDFISTVTNLGNCSFYRRAGSRPVSIRGRFETCPTTVGWSADLCGRSAGKVDVGAGFEPALLQTGLTQMCDRT